MTKGNRAYNLRANGHSWPDICSVMDYSGYRCIDRAINIAKRYAQHNNQAWPPPVTEHAPEVEGQDDHECGNHLLVDGDKAMCGVCKARYEWSVADDGWLEQ